MTRRALAGFMRGPGLEAKAVQTLRWGRTGAAQPRKEHRGLAVSLATP